MDTFVRVLSVGFDNKQASNEALELLKGLSDLKWIYVGGELRVIDGSESGINGWRRNDTQQPPPIDTGFTLETFFTDLIIPPKSGGSKFQKMSTKGVFSGRPSHSRKGRL